MRSPYKHIVLNNHTTKALPCINTQQTAAKTISKDQQTLMVQLHFNISNDDEFSITKRLISIKPK